MSISLLETGNTELLAGGAAFPFALPPGFAGFDTPATFASSTGRSGPGWPPTGRTGPES